jgi:amino acid adenylation domain-containing protein
MIMQSREATYPLSSLQQGMLFHGLSAPQSGLYVQQLLCALHEDLDVVAFRRAWQQVVERHPILRASFHWEGLDEPVQREHPQVELPLAEHDCRDLPGHEQDQQREAFLKADRTQGFDFTEAPLMRVTLMRLAEADYLCVWTFHHVLLDGRSHTMIVEEVFRRYEAIRQGQELSLTLARSFHSFIEWRQQQDWSRSEGFWRQLLQGFRAPTPLLSVPVAPGSKASLEAEPGQLEMRLPVATTSALEALARRTSLTLNTLVQGAWAVLLSRYSGEEDVVFGATRACRHWTREGADSVVGLVVNTLPVRAHVSPQKELLAFLRELRDQSLALRPHEHTPLTKVQDWSEVPRGTGLFDSIVVFEKYLMNSALRAQGGNWRHREFKFVERTNYPLALCVYGDTEILVKVLYLRPRFDEATIDRLLRHFQTVLEGVAADPEQRLATLPLVTQAERRQLLVEWNDTRGDFPRDRTIHRLVEEQVEKTPDGIAVLFAKEALTYRELNERANQLAHHLRALGVSPGVWTGICLKRSADMIVGVLAILKAGGAYVPLDPAYPKDRLAFMLEDTRAPVLLTQQDLLERLPATEARVLCLDTLGSTLAGQSKHNPDGGVDSNGLAYVIYTSGSTGKPKGVVLRHYPVVNLIDWVNGTFAVGPGDHLLFVTSLNFDLSVYDIFGILAAGGTVRVASAEELKEADRLVHILCEEPITFWDSAPPMLQQLVPFFSSLPPQRQSRLRLVFLSGDWIPVPMPDQVRKTFPEARVISLGGATEAAIWSNFYPIGAVDPSWPSIPYGKPIRNARYHVLDANLEPVPVGVPAELHIGGLCLAEGYLNRPELTAEKFIADRFSTEPGARLYKTGDLARYFPDGNLEFLGRIDSQVKIRGFRIELGEIEAVLGQHPAVSNNVVLARKDDSGGRYLVAYVVLHPGQKPDPSDFRSFLQRQLPEYMVPPHFVILKGFPLNPNGKIDRKALPAPDSTPAAAARTMVAPRYDVERDLVAVWESVLKVTPIGVTDNFFELGGHSLQAAILMARIKSQLGANLPLGILLQAPTVEKMAAIIQHDLEAGSESTLVPLHEGGSYPPLFMIAGVGGHVFTFHKFARLLGAEQPVYGVKAIGVDGVQTPPDRIEDIAAHYVKEILALRPRGPYVLSGYSIGAVVAYELALQLKAHGQQTEALIVFDCPAPGYPKRLPLGRRVLIHLKNLAVLGFPEKKAYLRDRFGQVKARILHALGLTIRMAPEIGGVEALPQTALKRVWAALITANNRYRPQQQFHGKIVLFKAEEGFNWAATVFDDPLMGWGQWGTGDIETHTVPGSHMEMFHEKNVGLVAAKLKESLRLVAAS